MLTEIFGGTVNKRLILVIFAVFFSLYLIATRLTRKRANGLSTIPGPKGLPLIGHTLQMAESPHRYCQQWAAQYGEVFKVQLGWENWVFLNSPEAVKEIMDKQSAITSGRQPMPVLLDLISGGKRFLLMSYSPQWRKLRAIVHKLLTPKASAVFKPSQEFETKQLLSELLMDNENQEKFYLHVRRYTTSVVMTSTYGRRIPSWVSKINQTAMT